MRTRRGVRPGQVHPRHSLNCIGTNPARQHAAVAACSAQGVKKAGGWDRCSCKWQMLIACLCECCRLLLYSALGLSFFRGPHIQVVLRLKREPTKSSSALPTPMTDDDGGDNSEASNCMSEDEREVLPRPLPLISLVFCFPPFPSSVLFTSIGSTFHGHICNI